MSLDVVLLCTSGPGGELISEVGYNITAVLGEDVYLTCRYVGENEVLNSRWRRQFSSTTYKKLAGFSNKKPFSHQGFSEPDSVTNLTVKMDVFSVEAEGKYICEFETEEEYYDSSIFLTVIGKQINFEGQWFSTWNSKPGAHLLKS